MEKKKILLIDDDRVILDNLSTLFRINDFEVFSALDGAEGIDIAILKKPDIIVCDVIMRQVNGFEVLKSIRSNVELFATPFIFLSGVNERESLRHGMDLGADDYLIKPFDNKTVLNAVNIRLQKHLSFKNNYESKIDELKKTLISSIPHEYKTPLHSILGFSQFLKDHCYEVSKEEASKMLDMIYRSGKRLLNLFVNFNLYYSFHSEFDFERYQDDTSANPNSFIEEQAQELAKYYNKKYSFSLMAPNETLKISPEHLTKILHEILDNAYKFSNEDTIHIKSFLDIDYFIILIENYGKPLSKDRLSKIGAFTQFDRDMQEQQGSGLGFTIARSLAKIYGGDLEIFSDYQTKNSVIIKLLVEK